FLLAASLIGPSDVAAQVRHPGPVYVMPKSMLTPADFEAAERLVESIESGTRFVVADFKSVPDEAGRKAIGRYANCKFDHMNRGYNSYELTLYWRCRRVSSKTPVALTVHFLDGKVAQLEMHNADLIKDNG
ncbi:MAG: hypothetical protein WBA55_00155, partial [Allopontixanthobacter sediminis]